MEEFAPLEKTSHRVGQNWKVRSVWKSRTKNFFKKVFKN